MFVGKGGEEEGLVLLELLLLAAAGAGDLALELLKAGDAMGGVFRGLRGVVVGGGGVEFAVGADGGGWEKEEGALAEGEEEMVGSSEVGSERGKEEKRARGRRVG